MNFVKLSPYGTFIGGFFSLYLPHLTPGPDGEAELHGHGLSEIAETREPLSRSTPAEDFRTVRSAMFVNMLTQNPTRPRLNCTKKEENVIGNHTRPLHEARHFAQTKPVEQRRRKMFSGLG